jgi:hypothetical protein
MFKVLFCFPRISGTSFINPFLQMFKFYLSLDLSFRRFFPQSIGIAFSPGMRRDEKSINDLFPFVSFLFDTVRSTVRNKLEQTTKGY